VPGSVVCVGLVIVVGMVSLLSESKFKVYHKVRRSNVSSKEKFAKSIASDEFTEEKVRYSGVAGMETRQDRQPITPA
jgi:hypothetical protein